MDMYDRIDNLLKDNKISKRKLSIDLDIPYTTLASMFKRKSTSVDIETIKKIAKYLDTDIDYLVSGAIYAGDLKLGERVRLFRLEKKISRTQLAKNIGCDIKDIQDLENNNKLPKDNYTLENIFTNICDDPCFLLSDGDTSNLSTPIDKSYAILYTPKHSLHKYFLSEEQACMLKTIIEEFNKQYMDSKDKNK